MVVPLPVAFIRFLISINRFWKFQYEVEEIATRLLDFHYNITVVSIFFIILVRSDMQLKSCFKFIIFEVFCNKCDGTMLMCHWNAFLCSLVYTDYKKKRCQLKSFGKRDYRLFKVTWLTWLNQLRRGRSLPGPLVSQLIPIVYVLCCMDHLSLTYLAPIRKVFHVRGTRSSPSTFAVRFSCDDVFH